MCKGIILNGESLYLLCGCYIIARIPLKVGLNIFNKAYLETKQKRMSHLYDNSDF